MEMRDIYDAQGNPTGRVIENRQARGPQDYLLHAIVILRGGDGRYLLQQRSLHTRYSPGKWDVTGGGVSAGETGQAAAIRETREELGLTLDPAHMVYGGRLLQNANLFFDMWGAWGDFAPEDCAWSTWEVSGVRAVDYQTFRQTVSHNKDEAFMRCMDEIHDRMERAE